MLGSFEQSVDFFIIGTIIPTSNISGTVEVVMIAEYSSHKTLVSGSDKAWNRWLAVVPSHPDEGLFFRDLIALAILLSLMTMLELDRSIVLPLKPHEVQQSLE